MPLLGERASCAQLDCIPSSGDPGGSIETHVLGSEEPDGLDQVLPLHVKAATCCQAALSAQSGKSQVGSGSQPVVSTAVQLPSALISI